MTLMLVEFMKERTKQLLDQLEQAHDWECETRGAGARLVHRSTCRVCGFTRTRTIDPNNGNHESYTFATFHGEAVTLAEAAAVVCCQ
jgi:hypothetical protein